TSGILKRKGKMVVANDLELRKELVQHFHDEAIASQVAQVFLDQVYKLHGLPESILNFGINTNYHTSTKTTPYEAVYFRTPHIHVPYIPGDSRVKEVDRTLQAREEAIKVFKFHLKRSQDRMRNQANKHRTDRQFKVGDWVYLKLQPHRQDKESLRRMELIRAKSEVNTVGLEVSTASIIGACEVHVCGSKPDT
nr:reverse transcriptase [Tanacetum cinerariifolium]